MFELKLIRLLSSVLAGCTVTVLSEDHQYLLVSEDKEYYIEVTDEALKGWGQHASFGKGEASYIRTSHGEYFFVNNTSNGTIMSIRKLLMGGIQ